jgi:hypothetical protein
MPGMTSQAAPLDSLRTGAFFTRERVLIGAGTLAAWILIPVVLVMLTLDTIYDSRGWPIGVDFSQVWAAGVMVLRGQAEAVYDFAAHYAVQQELFGENAPYLLWLYPPNHLMVAGTLANLPYLVALTLWMGLTLMVWMAAVRAIVPGLPALLVALAFPAVLMNLGYGQNGFLTAGLLGLALAFLDKRPVLAGIFIGLLAYKPHFGMLIPLVLMLSGRWTVFFSAAATVCALVALTTAIFGVDIWFAFIEATQGTREEVLEIGLAGWQRLQSIFAAVRNLGGPVGLAYAAQGAIALFCLVSVSWLWWSKADQDLKNAGLAAAALLMTPYVLDYDHVVMGVAYAFLIRHGLKHGFLPWEAAGITFMGLMAFFYQDFGLLGIPMGFSCALATLLLALGKAWTSLREDRSAIGGEVAI